MFLGAVKDFIYRGHSTSARDIYCNRYNNAYSLNAKHSLRFLTHAGRLEHLIVHTTSQQGIGSKCFAVQDAVTPQTCYDNAPLLPHLLSQNRPHYHALWVALA